MSSEAQDRYRRRVLGQSEDTFDLEAVLLENVVWCRERCAVGLDLRVADDTAHLSVRSAARKLITVRRSAMGRPGRPMDTLGRRSSRRIHGAIPLAALLAAMALVASAGCGDDEDSCNCFCSNQAKVCATTTEGRTGCARTLGLFTCSPSGCCNYCCDP